MNKKRLVSMLLVSAMTAALFTGCGSDGNQTSGDSTTSAGTNSTTEEAGIKEFTAFFAVAGSEINDDNEVQQLIAEKMLFRTVSPHWTKAASSSPTERP